MRGACCARLLALLAGVVLVLGAAPGGSPHAQTRGHGDHDLARRALEEGKVLPLRTVLEKVEREYQGRVLRVEFEQHDERFIYEIRLLQADGRMLVVIVDAVNGEVLRVKRKEH